MQDVFVQNYRRKIDTLSQHIKADENSLEKKKSTTRQEGIVTQQLKLD